MNPEPELMVYLAGSRRRRRGRHHLLVPYVKGDALLGVSYQRIKMLLKVRIAVNTRSCRTGRKSLVAQ